MADYKVTSEQLSNVSTQLSTGSRDIEAQLSGLNAYAADHTEAQWHNDYLARNVPRSIR